MPNLPTIFRFCDPNLPIANLPKIFRYHLANLPILETTNFCPSNAANCPNQRTIEFAIREVFGKAIQPFVNPGVHKGTEHIWGGVTAMPTEAITVALGLPLCFIERHCDGASN